MFVRHGSGNTKVECFHIKADLKISSEQVNPADKLKAEHRHLLYAKGQCLKMETLNFVRRRRKRQDAARCNALQEQLLKAKVTDSVRTAQ